MGDVSVVIPYRERPFPGMNHVNDAIDYVVADRTNVREVFVVNNDTKKFVPRNKDKRIKVINIYSKVWNSAWARNVGLKKASGKYVANIDADVIVPGDYFSTCVKIIGDKRTAATGKVRFAKGHNWEKILNASWAEKEKLFGNEGHRSAAQGLLFVQRTFFIAVKGYNELLSGWGGADVDIVRRLQKIHVTHMTIRGKYYPIHLPNGTRPFDRGPHAKRKNGNYSQTKVWGDPKSTWWMP